MISILYVAGNEESKDQGREMSILNNENWERGRFWIMGR